MKSITVKVNSQTKVLSQINIVTKDGQPNVIKSPKNVNFELIDNATGKAPHHIVTKRVNKDLHIAFDENGNETDLIIEDFYESGENALIGMAEDGQYYYYVPDTGKVADYVTELMNGDIEGQALGGTAYPTPWWIGASDSSNTIIPWLVGLAGVGLAAALFNKDDDDDTTPVKKEVDPTGIQLGNSGLSTGSTTGSNITIIPTSDPKQLLLVRGVDAQVNYSGHDGLTITSTVVAKRDENGKWSIDNEKTSSNLIGVKIDADTGVISLPASQFKNSDVVVKAIHLVSSDVETKEAEKQFDDTTAPDEPTITPQSTGSVNVTVPEHKDSTVGDKVVVTVPLHPDVTATDEKYKGKTEVTVELEKQPNGSWTSSDPSLVSNIPAGSTTATIPADKLKNGGEVKAHSEDKSGNSSKEVKETIKDEIPEPTVEPKDNGDVTVTPDTTANKVTVTYTDENGKNHEKTFEKDPATNQWKSNDPTDSGLINPTTGVVTIPANQIKDGTDVAGNQRTPKGESSFETVTAKTDNNVADKPNVESKDNGDVTVTPTTDANKTTAKYTDKTGEEKEKTFEKDPTTNQWKPTDPADSGLVNPTTGVVTIPSKDIQNNTLVTGTQETPKGKGEDSTVFDNGGQLPKVPTPAIESKNDGSATVTPAQDATKVNVKYTDEDGKTQEKTFTKDPATNQWKANDPADSGLINPTTGVVTIPAESVKDGSDVTANQTTPIGDSPNNSVTAKDDIPEPTVKANDDGSVTVTPAPNATAVTVEYNDEDGKIHTSTFEKDPTTNQWKANDPANSGLINPTTGVVSIPADQLKDGSEVVAKQTTPQGVSGEATDRMKADKTADKPTAEAEKNNNGNYTGNIVTTPGQDNTELVVDFTDSNNQPQTITATKQPDGTWTAVDKDGKPVSTTPTTNGTTPFIDPTTGKITLPNDAVNTENPVEATGKRIGADPTKDDVQPTAKPVVTEQPKSQSQDNDVDITAEPGKDNTKTIISYTDENGNPQTITTTKQPDGTWTAVDGDNNPVSTTPTTDDKTPFIDPTTGKVTLPKDSVDNSKPVTVTGEKDGSVPAKAETDPTDKPTVTEQPKGSDNDGAITAKPGDDNTKAKIDFIDENGKPQTVVVAKDPTTGEWKPAPESTVTVSPTPTTDDKTPFIDPKTGTVTLPKDSVDNSKPVTVTGEKDGSVPAKDETHPVDTTPPAQPELTANDNGSVSVKVPEDADTTKVDLKVTDPTTGKEQPVTLTKQPDGSWTSSEPEIVPNIPVGQDTATIPADKVKDNTPVTATATDDNNNTSEPVSETAKKGGDDTKAPTLEKAEVPSTGDKVELTYDEPLDPANPPKAEDFTVTVDGKPVTPESVSVEGNKVTLNLKPEDKVEQNKPVTVSYTDPTTGDDDKAVQDPYGNDAASLTNSPVDNKSGADSTPPAQPKLTANDNGSVSVKVPEDADTTKVDLKVTDPTTGEEKPVTLTKQPDGSWTSSEPTIVPNIPVGQDTAIIPADKVKDNTPVTATATDDNNNTSEPTTATATKGGDDTKAPELVKAEVPSTGDKVELTYDEPLDPANPPKAEDFTVTVDGKPVTPESVSVEGNKVTLNLKPEDKVEQNKPVTVSYTDPTTGDDDKAVQDPYGNDAASLTNSPVDNKSGADSTPPAQPKLTANDNGSVSVKVPEDADTTKVDLKVTDPTTGKEQPVTLTKQPDGSWTSSEPEIVPNIPVGQDTATIPADKVKDNTPVTATATDGNNNTSEPTTATATKGGDDTKAPEFVKAEVPSTGDKVELTYDEPLDPANPPKAEDFTVTVDGKPVTPESVSVEGNKVTLNLKPEDKVEQNKPVTVSYTDPTTGDDDKAVQDPYGNDAASLTNSPVDNKSGADSTPPAQPKLTANDNGSVSVKVPEDADTTKVDLKVTDPTTGEEKPVTLTKQPDGSWTSSEPTIVPNIPVGQDTAIIPADKVKDNTPVTATATDDNNNTSEPTTATATKGGDDTKAPELVKAEVPSTGDKVELTYDEPLDPANPPKAEDFTVTVDGKPVTPESVSVEGNKVTLNLKPEDKVEQNKPVTVSYTDPTTGDDDKAVQDPYGNDAASLTNSPVDNKSGADSTPPAQPKLTANDNGSVSVKVPEDADTTKVDLKVTDPTTGEEKPVTLTKQPDGSWTSSEPTIVPDIPAGQDTATIPADKVKDNTPVTATATDDNNNTSEPTTATATKGGDDTKAPELVKAEVPSTGDKVELTYDEPLDPANPPKAEDFTVTVDGKPVTPESVSVEGNKVTLNLKPEDKVEQNKPVTVSYTDPTTGDDDKAVQDPYGNDAASLTNSPVDNKSGADSTPPAQPKLTANDNGSVSVKVPEDADTTKVDLKVTDPTTGEEKPVTLTKQPDGSWTSSEPTIVPNIPVGQDTAIIPADKVKDNTPVTATATDDNNNTSEPTTATATKGGDDTKAPELEKAEVPSTGDKVELTYDEPLDPANPPKAEDFTVTVDGKPVTPESVSVEGNKVTLNLKSEDKVEQNKPVTVSYNDPTTGDDDKAVQDPYGNDAASLTNSPVDNKSGADSTPPAQPELTANDNGSVSVKVPEDADTTKVDLKVTDPTTGKEQPVTLTKQPDGSWTSSEPEIVPNIPVGQDTATIPADKVKDNTPVTATATDGNNNTSEPTTATATKGGDDTKAPEFVKAEVPSTGDKVELTYDEPLDPANPPKAEDFTVTVDGKPVTPESVSVEGNKVTLNLKPEDKVEQNKPVTVSYTDPTTGDDDKAVQDPYGNDAASLTNSPVDNKSGADSTPPAQPKLTANDNGSVSVKVPEDADTTKVDLKVTDPTTGEEKPVTLTKQPDGSWTSSEPTIVPDIPAGQDTATIPADKVKDNTPVTATATDDNNNTSEPTTATATKGGDDTKAPELVKAEVPSTGDKVELTYDEPLDPANPPKAEDFTVTVDGKPVTPESVSVEGNKVTLNLKPEDKVEQNKPVTVSYTDPTTGDDDKAVQDPYGNDAASLTNSPVDNKSGADSTPPAQPKLTANDNGSVSVKVPEDADTTKVDLKVTDPTTGEEKPVTLTKQPDGSWTSSEPTIVPNIPVGQDTAIIPADKVKDNTPVTATATDDNNNTSEPTTATATKGGDDTKAPELEKAEVPSTGDKVELTYDEPLDPANPPKAEDFTVTVDGKPVTPESVSVEGNKVTLNLKSEDKVEQNKPVTVSYNDPTTGDDDKAVQDPYGNDAASLTNSPVDNKSGADSTPPAQPELTANDNGSVSVKVPEDADTTKVDLKVTDPTTGKEQPVTLTKQPDGSWTSSEPEIVPNIPVGQDTATIPADKVKDNTPVTATATDGNNNTSEPTTATATKGGDDTKAPEFVKAEVPSTGDKVELTYDEPLDPANPPKAEDFTVTVDGKPVTPESVSVEGNKVTLNLKPEDKVEQNKPVTVSYTDPTTGDDDKAVQDPYGNDAASLTNSPVDNKSGADSTPPAQPKLTANDNGSVSVKVPEDADTTKVDLKVTDPTTGEEKPVTLTKQPDGSWTSSEPTIVPNIPVGQDTAIIPADKVKDNTPVTATATDDNNNTSEPTTATATKGGDDTKAPELVKAEVPSTGDKVELTYDEPLDPANPPKAEDFTVTVDGKPVTPESVSVEGNKVTLNLKPEDKVEQNKPVTVSYTDPTTGDDDKAVQDPYGNDAASLTNSPVDNKSGADSTPPAQPKLTANDNGSVSVKVPEDADTTKVDLKVTDPTTGEEKPVTLTKQPDGSWTSSEPTIVPDIPAGQDTATIPADKVKDNTPVTATATDDNNNTSEPTTATATKGGDDTKAPELVKAEVPSTGDKVELTYDEPLDPANPPKAEDFTVTVDGKPVTPESVSVEGNKVTLNLKPEDKVEQNKPVTVSYTDPTTGDDDKAVQDPYGNDAASLTNSPVDNKSGADSTPPAQPKLTANDNGSVSVKVPEDADTTKVDLKVTDPTTGEEKPVTLTKQPDGSWTSSEPTIVPNIPVGQDTAIIPADKVKDNTPVTATATDDNNNTSEPTTATATKGGDDTKAPELEKAEVPSTGDKVELTYDEPLDPANPPKAEDFTVTVDGKPVTPESVSVEGNKVTLNLKPEDKVEQNKPVTVSYTDPTTGDDDKAVQDPYGNDAASLTNSPVDNKSGADSTPPAQPKLTANDNGSVSVKVPEDADTTKVDLKVTDPTTGEEKPVTLTKQPDGSWTSSEPEIVPNIPVGQDTATIPADKVKDNTPVTATATDDNNNTSEPVSETAKKGGDDTKAPTLEKAEVPSTGDKVELTYDEPLDPANPPKAEDFTVTVDGKPVTPESVSVEGNKVTLNLKSEDKVEQNKPVTVSYNDPTTGDDDKAVQDPYGNDAASLTDKPVDNKSGADSTPPAQPELTANDNGSVSVKVPEDADTTKVDLKVTDPTTGKEQPVTLTKQPDGSWTSSEPEIVPNIPVGQDTATIPADKVKDNTPVTATATDDNNNTSEPTTATATKGGDDTKAPEFVKAEVPSTGDKVELTYDEPLDPANPPKAEDFTVTVDGKPVTPESVSVEGNKVTLNLKSEDKVEQNKPVTVSYNDPTTGDDDKAVQDPYGNDAASLTDKPVDNKSGADSTPPAQPELTAKDDGTVDVKVPADPDASKVDLKVTDPTTGEEKPVTLTKQPDGSWTSSEPTIVPDIPAGQDTATIPADKVKDNTPVTATATDGNNNTSEPVSETAKKGGDDTKAPEFVKAEVPSTGDKVELTYDEPLDPANPPKAEDFTVTVDGKPVTPESVSVEGNKVTLNLKSEDKVEQNKPVTVSYNDPTTGDDDKAVQDPYGNDAASLTNSPVDNNSTNLIKPDAPTSVTIGNGNDFIVRNEIDNANKVPVEVGLPDNAKEGQIVSVNGVDKPLTADDITAKKATVLVDAPAEGEKLTATATIKDPNNAQNVSDPVSDEATRDTKNPSIAFASNESFGGIVDGSKITDLTKPIVMLSDEKVNPNSFVAGDFTLRKQVAGKPAETLLLHKDGEPLPPETERGKWLTVKIEEVNDGTNVKSKIIITPMTQWEEGANYDVTVYSGNAFADDAGNTTRWAAGTQPGAENGAGRRVEGSGNSNYNFSVAAATIDAPTKVTIANGDNTITTGEMTNNQVSVKVDLPTTAKVGQVVDVNGVTHTLTQPDITNGSVTVNVPAPAEGAKLTATATIKDLTTNNVSNGTTVEATRDTVAKAPEVEIGSSSNVIIATDLFKNARNQDAVKVTVRLPDDVQAGDMIYFKPSTHTATVNRAISQAEVNAKEIVFDVTAPREGQELVVDARITDKWGNQSALVTDTETRDTVATAPTAVTIGRNTDEFITSNEITAENKVQVIVRLPDDVKAGDVVVLGDGSRHRIGNANVTAKAIAINVDAPAEGQSLSVTAKIEDAAGNQSPEVTATAKRDTTPPKIESATVSRDGKTVVLDYDEALHANKADPANFTVNVAGKAVKPTAVTVNGDKVTLTLPDADAVKQNQTVTLSYNDPTANNDANATQDLAGNDAVSLTNSPVKNDSTVSPTPTLPPINQPTKTVTDINMTVATNDIKLTNIKATYGAVAENSGTVTRSDDGSIIHWGTGGSRNQGDRNASLTFQNITTADGDDLSSSFAVATVLHKNAGTPSTTNLRQTTLNLEASVTLNGKTGKLNTADVGTIYMLETPASGAGTDDDFFIFVPKATTITIDGQQYRLILDKNGHPNSDANKALVETAVQSMGRSTNVPTGLRDMSATDKAAAIYERSPENGQTNSIQLAFKLEAIGTSATAIKPVTLPEAQTGKVADTTSAWTSGATTGVTINNKAGNTFGVNKNGKEIGEFVGQADGSYTFTAKDGMKSIDGGETLKASFTKGNHVVNLNLTGKLSNNIAQGEDLVDSVYKVASDSAKGIDFSLIGKTEMIDLSNIEAGSLQGVTLANVNKASNNGLYIKGDASDTITLGTVLETNATIQTDGNGRWTKGETKTGSTIDGDNATVYDIWTNGTATLYIDKDIQVL